MQLRPRGDDAATPNDRGIRDDTTMPMNILEPDVRGIQILARSERMQIAEILRITDAMLQRNEHAINNLKSIIVDVRSGVIERLTVAGYSKGGTANPV